MRRSRRCSRPRRSARSRKLFDGPAGRADDVDLYEINEAFAVVDDGGDAGHAICRTTGSMCTAARARSGIPIGASGARILVTLIGALRQHGQRGVAALCIGGGPAMAVEIQ